MKHETGRYRAEHLVACRCDCGESPIWDPRNDRLYWVDTGERTFHEYDRGSGHYNRRDVEYLLQSIGRRRSGGWIAIDLKGLVLWNHETGENRFLGYPEEGKPHMCMSDGAVGPDGRFYAGSLNFEVLDAPDGSIYRVDKDGSISVACEGLALPNGLAFSPDGSTLYVTEMFANRILAYDFDSRTGTAANRRVLVDVPAEEGLPDGLIVDREGFLWSAHWQGFRITRYAPDGARERIIELPVPTPTCMAFGGEELDELYVTTARKGCSSEQLAEYPQSGDLFRIKLNVQGRLEPEFAG
jgi:sugar lactone lactonase YvrE